MTFLCERKEGGEATVREKVETKVGMVSTWIFDLAFTQKIWVTGEEVAKKLKNVRDPEQWTLIVYSCLLF